MNYEPKTHKKNQRKQFQYISHADSSQVVSMMNIMRAVGSDSISCAETPSYKKTVKKLTAFIFKLAA